MSTLSDNPWLSRLSKICVFATLFLIFLGAIVTTYDAGMAAPNAPHVDGALLNPKTPGTDLPWYKNPPLFKEHSHRLAAITVGLAMGALTAMLWRNWTAFYFAVLFMGMASLGKKAGLSPELVAQLRVWPAMGIFIGLLLAGAKRRGEKISADQKLVLIGYIATCIQAALGSLRVEIETASTVAFVHSNLNSAYASMSSLMMWSDTVNALSIAAKDAALGDQKLALATNIRTFHGVFAQVFLALLVVIAARLSPIWKQLGERPKIDAAGKIHRMAIVLMWLYIIQLACAAYLRHRGLGLVIPTWPSAGSGLLPEHWSHAVGMHFLHSRVLPILITGHVIGLAIVCAKRAAGEVRITRLGWGILGLVVLQVILGIMVIWKGRHPHITNTHVMVGAFICACTALLAVRSWRVRA
jgi:heme A synthase